MSFTTTATNPTDSSKYFGFASAKAKSDLDMAAFMKLLVVQLQNQNPLEPMSDSEFYAQLAQMGTVQGVQNMAKSTESSQAASLIGKTVTATRPMTESGTGTDLVVTGTVVKTVVKNGVNYLALQEADGGIVEVKMSDVTSVKQSTDLSAYTNLIGKSVFAAVNRGTLNNPVYTAVSGTVTALYIDKNVPMAQVTGSDGSVYDVELSTISAIKS